MKNDGEPLVSHGKRAFLREGIGELRCSRSRGLRVGRERAWELRRDALRSSCPDQSGDEQRDRELWPSELYREESRQAVQHAFIGCYNSRRRWVRIRLKCYDGIAFRRNPWSKYVLLA